jgi:hypothetical protein
MPTAAPLHGLLAGLMFGAAPPMTPAVPEAAIAWPDSNPTIAAAEWPRAAHGAAAVGDRLYIVGGVAEDGSHRFPARVDVLDLKERRWDTAADLPTPRAFAGVAALDGGIYVVGGLEDGASGVRDSAVVERFDTRTGAWQTLPPLPTPRSRLAAAAVGGAVYAIGGLTTTPHGASDSAVVERFDPETNQWSRCADLPTPRHGHAAAPMSGRIYALGGYSLRETLEPLASVEAFDPATGRWSPGPTMISPRAWFATVECGGSLIAVGGAAAPERFPHGQGNWEPIATQDAQGRRFAAASIRGLVWVFGGESPGPSFTQVLDPARGEWLRPR